MELKFLPTCLYQCFKQPLVMDLVKYTNRRCICCVTDKADKALNNLVQEDLKLLKCPNISKWM